VGHTNLQKWEGRTQVLLFHILLEVQKASEELFPGQWPPFVSERIELDATSLKINGYLLGMLIKTY
jgi:hypothetical protein